MKYVTERERDKKRPLVVGRKQNSMQGSGWKMCGVNELCMKEYPGGIFAVINPCMGSPEGSVVSKIIM